MASWSRQPLSGGAGIPAGRSPRNQGGPCPLCGRRCAHGFLRSERTWVGRRYRPGTACPKKQVPWARLPGCAVVPRRGCSGRPLHEAVSTQGPAGGHGHCAGRLHPARRAQGRCTDANPVPPTGPRQPLGAGTAWPAHRPALPRSRRWKKVGSREREGLGLHNILRVDRAPPGCDILGLGVE